MRKLSIIFILLFLITPLSALAYNGQSAGIVKHTYDTTFNPLAASISYTLIEHTGYNAAGNHVVVTYHTSAVGISPLISWEITKSGTVLGMLDLIVIPDTISGYYLELIPNAPNDSSDNWWALIDNENLYSIEIGQEGGLNQVDSATGYLTPAFNVMDDCILSYYNIAGNRDFRTFQIEGNGDISVWFTTGWANNPTFTNLQDACLFGDYDNTDTQYFLWVTNDAVPNPVGTVYIGKIHGEDLDPLTDFGEIQHAFVGTKALTYAGDATLGDGLKINHVDDRIHAIFSGINNGLGHNGNDDIGIEFIDFDNSLNMVSSGTPYIEDTGFANATLDVININGHLALYYPTNSFQDKYVNRMIWNLNEPSVINQTNVSQRLDIFDSNATDNHEHIARFGSCATQLGTSAFVASVITDDSGDMYIVTTEQYIPPTVDTLDFYSLSTDYNEIVDASFFASGEVTDIGSTSVTEYGFCLAETEFPLYSDTTFPNTDIRDYPFEFEDELLDLLAGRNYFGRAYACNDSGTGYGDVHNQYSFPEYANTILMLQYEPLDINNGTITDISGFDNDVTFSWWTVGTSVLEINSTFGLIGEEFSIVKPTSDIILPNDGGPSWDKTKEELSGVDNPLYLFITSMDDMSGLGVMNLWYFMWVASMLAGGVYSWNYLKSPFLTIGIIMGITVIFYHWGPIPLWMMFFQGVLGIYLLYKDSGVSFGRGN